MPKQEFPKWLYHATAAARLVTTMAEYDALRAEGWAEDPDTAAGRARPHPDPAPEAPWPGDLTPVQRAATPPVPYPKWLYNAQGGSRLVKTAADHLALGDGWHESPDEAKKAAAAAPASTPPPTDLPPLPPPEPVVPLSSSTPPPPTIRRPIADLTALKAEDLIAYINTLSVADFEYLAEIAMAEEADRNRVTVKNAINLRIDILTRPPAENAAS